MCKYLNFWHLLSYLTVVENRPIQKLPQICPKWRGGVEATFRQCPKERGFFVDNFPYSKHKQKIFFFNLPYFVAIISVRPVKLIHGLRLFSHVKCTIFWLNIDLRVLLNLYVLDFPKSTSKYFFYILVLVSPKHPLLEAFCL